MVERSQCSRTAKRLGLAPTLVKLAEGGAVGLPLRRYFGNLRGFFAFNEEERNWFGGGNVVPLWDDGNFGHVVGFDLRAKVFVQFHVEEAWETRREGNLQQMLLGHFLRMYEQEMPDDEFREHAAELGFEHTEEIINAYAEERFGDVGGLSAWKDWLWEQLGD